MARRIAAAPPGILFPAVCRQTALARAASGADSLLANVSQLFSSGRARQSNQLHTRPNIGPGAAPSEISQLRASTAKGDA